MTQTASVNAEPRRRLTTVLAADICGYSHLAEKDEAAAVKSVEAIFSVFQKAVEDHRGRIFNRAGDGFLAEFPSVVDGVNAACAFVSNVSGASANAPGGRTPKVRAGLHVGDVVEQADGDLLGHGVNIASRLQSEAEPNGVLISLHAANLVRDKIDAQFRRRGPLALKNIDEPVVAFDVAAGGKQSIGFFQRSFRLMKRKPAGLAILGGFLVIFALNLTLVRNTFNGNQETRGTSAEGATPETAINQYAKLGETIVSSKIASANPNYQSILQSAIATIVDNYAEARERAPKASVVALYKGVLDQLTEGDLPSAAGELKKVSAALPQSPQKEDAQRLLGLLIFNADTQEALRIFEGLNENSNGGDSQLLSLLGELYLRINDPVRARGAYIALSRVPGATPQIKCHAEMGLAQAAWYLEDYETSKKYLQSSLVISRENHLVVEEAKALAQLGSLNILTENYDEAEKYRNAALLIERSLRDEHAIGKSLNMLGKIYYLTNRFDKAEAKFEEALKIRTKLGDQKGIASVSVNFSELYIARKEFDKAIDLLLPALEISRKQGTPNLISLHHESLAQIYAQTSEPACACAHIQSAEVALQDSPNQLEDRTNDLKQTLHCSPATDGNAPTNCAGLN